MDYPDGMKRHSRVPPRLVQRWLWHACLSATLVCLRASFDNEL